MIINNKIIYGGDPDRPIPKTTFGRILYDHLLSCPMKTEIMVDVFSGDKITAQQLLEDSCALAATLRVTGYASNAVLAIISENSLQFFIPLLASLYNNTIASLLSPTYTALELKHCLNIAKPKIVFCSSKCSRKLIAIQREKEFSFMETIVIIDSFTSTDGATSIKEFVTDGLRGSRIMPYNIQPLDLDPVNTPAVILYSSGTTGLPKGVTLSHYNLVVAHSIRAKMPFDKDNPKSTIGFAPLYHTMGLNRAFYAFFSSIRLVLMKRFVEDVFLRTIQDYQVEILAVPPPLMVLLARSPKVKEYDLSSLKFIACGGAPLGVDLENTVVKRLKLITAIQAYGFTEVTYAVLMLTPGSPKDGSCGFVVPLTSCKVIDPESGKALGPHQRGELCFKGPQTMLGYYNDERATREAIDEDGWVKSGDIGYYDEDGYFYIVDRLKELIKYKGYQVAPAELEGILLNHPQINDAAVVGLPDERSGELPMAFLVKEPEATVTENEIQDYIAGLVSPQKRLSGGVIFISEIPRNPTGKILRKDLRRLLQNYKQINKTSKL